MLSMKNFFFIITLPLLSLPALAEPTLVEREKAYILLSQYRDNANYLDDTIEEAKKEALEKPATAKNIAHFCLKVGEMEAYAVNTRPGVGPGVASNLLLKNVIDQEKMSELNTLVSLGGKTSLMNQLNDLQALVCSDESDDDALATSKAQELLADIKNTIEEITTLTAELADRNFEEIIKAIKEQKKKN